MPGILKPKSPALIRQKAIRRLSHQIDHQVNEVAKAERRLETLRRALADLSDSPVTSMHQRRS